MQSLSPDLVVAGVLSYFVFLFSTVVHEASHAFVARMYGDDTAADEGLITIDPTPHIRREPMGMVMMPLLGLMLNGFVLGWGSAPYDPVWARNNPRKKALMAMAGPMANLALALLAYGIISLGLSLGYFEYPDRLTTRSLVAPTADWMSGLTIFLSIGVTLNLYLCLFNLLPVPPLDGSSVITLLLPEKYALIVEDARSNPNYQMIGLFIVFGCGTELIYPIFTRILWAMF